MNALEQWERLNKCINVGHYIGTTAKQCIADELKRKGADANVKAPKAKSKETSVGKKSTSVNAEKRQTVKAEGK